MCAYSLLYPTLALCPSSPRRNYELTIFLILLYLFNLNIFSGCTKIEKKYLMCSSKKKEDEGEHCARVRVSLLGVSRAISLRQRGATVVGSYVIE